MPGAERELLITETARLVLGEETSDIVTSEDREVVGVGIMCVRWYGEGVRERRESPLTDDEDGTGEAECEWSRLCHGGIELTDQAFHCFAKATHNSSL